MVSFEYLTVRTTQSIEHSHNNKIAAELAYALSWRGSCKLKLKRYEEARKDLDESRSMEPDNSYLHLNYGIYYLETGDEAQAKHSFQKACELDKETEGLEKYWKNGRLIV